MFRSWLALAIALHLALATGYAWCTPDFEGPDENSHYEYAQHLANAGRLPLAPALAQARGLPQTDGAVLAHHPPLYYALLASLLVATGTDDTVFGPLLHPGFGAAADPGRHLRFQHERTVDGVLFGLRLVSVLLGAVTLWVVHRLGRTCCPGEPRVADLAVLLVACLPMWSFLHGVLNSDVLATTLASATVLALVRIEQTEPPTWRQAIVVGTLLGLSLLTKLTALFLVPLALVAILPPAPGAPRPADASARLTRVGGAFAIALALCGWAFARNHLLYGDALALQVHDAAFQPIPPEFRWGYLLGGFLPNVFTSLLGRFGWFSLPPHPALLWTAAVVVVLAAIGLVRKLRDRDHTCAMRTLWLLVLVLALVFAGTAHFNWKAPQPQGRLLFPAIGPAAVLLAAGLVRISAGWRHRRWLAALLPLAAAMVFFGWFRPAFAPGLAAAPPWHRSLVGSIVAPSTTPTIAWRDVPTSPTPQPPTLRWRDPEAPAGTRYTLYAYDHRGRVRLATHEWTQGAMVVQGDELTMPEAAWRMLPPGVDLFLRLRRVPATATEEPANLPISAPLPFRRS